MNETEVSSLENIFSQGGVCLKPCRTIRENKLKLILNLKKKQKKIKNQVFIPWNIPN